MEVRYPQHPQYNSVSEQYTDIKLRFTEFFDTFVMPSADRYLRAEGLPTIGSVKFRASALNQLEFKNFFEVVKNNQIWVAMRLHELIHL